MNNLLIYIGENEKFDVANTIKAIESITYITNSRKGDFIGAVFECEYVVNSHSTIIRISPEAETIIAGGLTDESLNFALELQSRLSISLHAIDTDYSFDVALSDFDSLSELRTVVFDTYS